MANSSYSGLDYVSALKYIADQLGYTLKPITVDNSDNKIELSKPYIAGFDIECNKERLILCLDQLPPDIAAQVAAKGLISKLAENRKLPFGITSKTIDYGIVQLLGSINEPAGQIPAVSQYDYVTVYSHHCHCLKCEAKHLPNIMTSGTVRVKNCTGLPISINVERCEHCGRFYIDKESLDIYERKFGVLLMEREYENAIPQKYNRRKIDFQEDTILSRCGYSAKGDQNIIVRRAILSYILDHHKAEKWELMEILSGFIEFRGYRCYKAVYLWEEDLEYVNNYLIDEQKEYGPMVFKKNRPKSRI